MKFRKKFPFLGILHVFLFGVCFPFFLQFVIMSLMLYYFILLLFALHFPIVVLCRAHECGLWSGRFFIFLLFQFLLIVFFLVTSALVEFLPFIFLYFLVTRYIYCFVEIRFLACHDVVYCGYLFPESGECVLLSIYRFL